MRIKISGLLSALVLFCFLFSPVSYAGSSVDVYRAPGVGKKIIPGYNDIVIPFDSARVPAANAPTWSSLIGNLNAYVFDINDYLEGSGELYHSYEHYSNVYPHLHWITNGLDVTDRAVNWEIEFTRANMDSGGVGSVFPATTIITAEATIPANTPDLTHMYTELPDMSGSSLKIGTYVKVRVRRVAAVGADPTNDPFALAVGLHIKENTIGSKTRSSK